MNSRRLKRKTALFGTEEAAILAAAGIQAAATAAGAALQSKSATDAAKQQAAAIQAQADSQANIATQTLANNNELQLRSQEFTRQQNEENRQIQRDIQTAMQIMTGQANSEARQERNKIQVKNGGNLGIHSLLRGGYNIPFTVTDGGGVIPIGQTPEGYNLYEIYGNDHEHYHKTRGGKSKTGVGIKFANGGVIEGEGNQNSNQGELLLTTPNDALFISKHSIRGFNPVNAVKNGMNPLDAFAIQENIKDRYNINDDGKTSSTRPVERNKHRRFRLAGGVLNPIDAIDLNVPIDFNTGNAAIASGYYNNQNNIAKYGKRLRHKAIAGTWANFAGAGVNTLGNIGGALFNIFGNNRGARILSNAYGDASQRLINAYNQMHGVDISSIKREDYDAAQAMANLLIPRVNVNPQIEGINRDARMQQRAVNANTLSSAARLNRLAGITDRAQQARNQIYAQASNQEQQMGAENMRQINQIAIENARLKTEANKDYRNAYLNLLMYNNDIENEKLAGIGEAEASAIMGSADARANARLANAQAIGSAITASGQSFGNAFSTYGKALADRENILRGYDTEDLEYIINNPNASNSDKQIANDELNRRNRNRFNNMQPVRGLDYVNVNHPSNPDWDRILRR